MELFHPVLPQPFVVEDVLLDDSGVLAVAAEMIGENLVKEAVFGDLSPSEIAEEQGISRQGVHDLIKRCDRLLEGYETKLKLVEKFNQTKAMVKEIQELTGQYKKSGDQALIDKIEEISEKIGQL